MPLHLIKLCVGCDSIRDLEGWIEERLAEKRRRRQPPEHIHTTRMQPKRAGELAGGSLYWVIRGEVACRERLIDIRPFVDKEGITRCRLVLDGKVVPVESRPVLPFQGWRYLAAKDAPRDLARGAKGAARLPEELRRELRSLGLL
jgi:hypothetical protein